jgi:hypothetical protein
MVGSGAVMPNGRSGSVRVPCTQLYGQTAEQCASVTGAPVMGQAALLSCAIRVSYRDRELRGSILQ